MFGTLAEAYVCQMESGMPHVENAVDTMARLENRKAMDEAVTLYSGRMSESLRMPVLDDDEISRCHNDCLKQAIDLFLSKSVFDHKLEYQRQMNVRNYSRNHNNAYVLMKNIYKLLSSHGKHCFPLVNFLDPTRDCEQIY